MVARSSTDAVVGDDSSWLANRLQVTADWVHTVVLLQGVTQH
jgi:hypothetical protein